jgi:hypothetical protein
MDRKDEGLDAKNATFYITYKYSDDDAWLGKLCHRIAAVRRSCDEDSAIFSLVGTIPHKESAQERHLFSSVFEHSKRIKLNVPQSLERDREAVVWPSWGLA